MTHILVVDDEQPILELIKNGLTLDRVFNSLPNCR